MEQTRISPIHSAILFAGILILLLLFVIKFFDISFPISVTTRTVSSELAVMGEGKVDVVPDTAEVSAGITVQSARTVEEAETKINEVNNKIIASMTTLGIPKEDLKTSNYSINPNYGFEPIIGQDTPAGFSGNATVTIKVKDTDKLSRVLAAATEAGANQVYNAGFTVDDPAKYREQARNEAIEDAKTQAKKLADQLGIKLGKVTNIAESGTGGQPYPIYKEAQDTRSAINPAPVIEPGNQTISTTVTLFFERK